jgi:hypothetical protein
MSNLESSPQETACGGRAAVAVEPTREVLAGRPVALGGPRGMRVTRTLPDRDRRMVGAWCFVDYYGPDDVSNSPGMNVAPHPHTGLQTVSWLVEGDVLHRDSIGSVQLVRPGQLNLMTAGHGISHSEQSPPDHPPSCTASSCGRRCRTGTAASARTSSTTRTSPCSPTPAWPSR